MAAEAPEKRGGSRGVAARAWACTTDEILSELEVDPKTGLAEAEADSRRKRWGPNRLREVRARSAWRILVEQFESLVVLLLAAAAITAFLFGETLESAAILVVLAVNGAIGFLMEIRAVRSMEALREMAQVEANVRRGGRVQAVPAEDLVPGDVVVLEGGDIVTADLRVLEASKLQADESTLTGESVPVSKGTAAVEQDAPLAERRSMLFKGTSLTRGSGEAIVVATGMETELGRISTLVEEAEPERTPLEKRLDTLGRRLVWLTLAIAAVVAVSGIVAGRDPFLIIETAIALAVASVPEGLPIVATIALARGMWRMARRNALVEQLSAVETLGSTSVILTDKTGTLTENRMTLVELAMPAGKVRITGLGMQTEGTLVGEEGELSSSQEALARDALRIGILCGNATLAEPAGEDDTRRGVGEPMEVALLVAGAKVGLRREELARELPELREEAFDPETRRMATFHGDAEARGHDAAGPRAYLVAVKGAPEAVIDSCERVATAEGDAELDREGRAAWAGRAEAMAHEGLRVLALARGRAGALDGDPYRDLTLLALAGFLDPPREEVRQALDDCRAAGIRVVMVTGDHAVTARKIARAVGLVSAEDGEGPRVVEGRELQSRNGSTDAERLLGAAIFARVSPEQKLDLIALHQGHGAVVAMTGDGVNDAPALKRADIGIAMGRRGTQVAKDAAAMVLQDDAFSTIVTAVEQGRAIFANIRKFVLYLLSCNVSEILVVGAAAVVNAPLPLLPLQILFLNLVTDVFPALALGVGEGGPGMMGRPPRDPSEPLLTRNHWLAIGAYGVLLTASVLGAMALALLGLGFDEERAVTVSFLTLAFGQIWHVFDMRDAASGPVRNEITRNVWIWGAIALCTSLLLAAVRLPLLAQVLKTADPGAAGWGIVLGASLLPLLAIQVLLLLGVHPDVGARNPEDQA